MARRSLPPLNALRAFEAFGRYGRMTLAAEELCVTHGAVSRQVRALEEHLGMRLTEGPKGRLTLTEGGLKLAQGLSRAFDCLEEAVPEPQAAPDVLRVSCQPTFAMKWLIPRLPSFIAAHPDTPVQIAESNGPFDFRADKVDLAVRMRSRDDLGSDDAELTPFLNEHTGVVASPDVAREIRSVEDLARVPRLHTRTYLAGWEQWRSRAGVEALPPAPVEREFDHYFYMIEAAAAGLGACVAPWAFVQRDVASGRLIAPLGFTPGGVVLALTPKGGATPAARRFRAWLVEQGQVSPQPSIVC